MSVDFGVRNEYSYGDLEKLHGHEDDSTNQVMNDVRQAAIKNVGERVAITGHDKSAKQLVKEDREELQKELGLLEASGEKFREIQVGMTLELVREGAGEALELATAGYETARASVHQMRMGDELNVAIERDT